MRANTTKHPSVVYVKILAWILTAALVQLFRIESSEKSILLSCFHSIVGDMSVPQSLSLTKSIKKKREKEQRQQKNAGGIKGPTSEKAMYAKQDDAASRYSTKMMNSIWGMYNQYSVHNLKSHKLDQSAASSSNVQQQPEQTHEFFNEYNVSQQLHQNAGLLPDVGSSRIANYDLGELGNAVAQSFLMNDKSTI